MFLFLPFGPPLSLSGEKPRTSFTSMPRRTAKEPVAEVFESVTDGLKQLYKAKIKPVEENYRFGEFYSPVLQVEREICVCPRERDRERE